MKNYAMSALFGIASLLLINMTSAYTGIYLVISRLSLIISGLLGIPGVILMILCDQLL